MLPDRGGGEEKHWKEGRRGVEGRQWPSSSVKLWWEWDSFPYRPEALCLEQNSWVPSPASATDLLGGLEQVTCPLCASVSISGLKDFN